jgi:L-rhamnose 1-dehydrogenase
MDKRIALVTGASRGIGRAIAQRLAQDGCHVIVNYPHDGDGPEETLRLIVEAGGSGEGIRADIGSVSEINEMFRRLRESHGHLDVLVNNAGTSTFEPLFEITESVWDRIQSVNLRGAFFCAQAAARIMLDTATLGRIVSITSISAHLGGRMEIAYCPSKAGLLSLMQAMCLELGPHGITCNSVSPGTVATDGVSHQMALAPGLLDRYVDRIPVGRLGDPSEVAAAVSFLASADASYINGAEILVDGGVLVNPE